MGGVENLKAFSLGGWAEKGGEERILSKQRSNGEELQDFILSLICNSWDDYT